MTIIFQLVPRFGAYLPRLIDPSNGRSLDLRPDLRVCEMSYIKETKGLMSARWLFAAYPFSELPFPGGRVSPQTQFTPGAERPG